MEPTLGVILLAVLTVVYQIAWYRGYTAAATNLTHSRPTEARKP